jgi:hypothetical protein
MADGRALVKQMGLKQIGSTVIILAAAMAGAVQAAPSADPKARAVVLQSVLDCRAIADKEQRLTCYDAAVGRLDLAQSKGEVVVVDREQVREVKRQAFGLQLPSLASFMPKLHDDIDEKLDVVLKSWTLGADGHRYFTFEDGSVWRAVDVDEFGREPRPQMHGVIRSGLMGSFFLSLEGAPASRVQRQR